MKTLSQPPTWSVVHRVGNERCCSWYRDGFTFATREEAQGQVEHHARNGRRALAVQTRFLDAVGLPIGWDADSVDWGRDHIFYSKSCTWWMEAA